MVSGLGFCSPFARVKVCGKAFNRPLLDGCVVFATQVAQVFVWFAHQPYPVIEGLSPAMYL